MGTEHTVRQGECLASLAARYGFHDWNTVYKHPDNAALRRKRPNPHALFPGDVVVIPDKGGRQVACATAARHAFTLARKPTFLRVRLRDGGGAPMAGKRYVLAVGGEELSGTTDGDGLVEQKIHAHETSAELRVYGDDPDVPEETWRLNLGHLDPVEELSGVQARLANLGLLRTGVTGTLDRETRTALAAFQSANGLEATGDLDDATRAKLEEHHDAT